ncbi:MAG: cell division protein FtsL [Eubacteriales bacterium]|nr:cell division protein FtsL [Eubacteriales bacterium]
MLAEKGNEKLDSRNYQREYYIEGNTARKLDAVPQRIERPERRREQERRVNPKVKKNVNRAVAFDLKYTLALVVATAFLFVSCVSMLSVQANITEQRRQIAMLERNLNKMTDANNETSKRLESSLDLTKVYDVAIHELGMVYPKTGQVISYKASNPDYVKQYKDIPVK